MEQPEREEDCQTIKVSRKDNLLECIWENKVSEEFEIDGKQLVGTTSRNIHGTYNEDGVIVWNTGNHWIKEGEGDKSS